MCRIPFNLAYSDSDGTVVSAQGRYKLVTASTWITFPITLGGPYATPDILTNGTYELQVQVTDDDNAVSGWQPANQTFEIETCPVVNDPPQVDTLTLLATDCCNEIQN